MLNMITEDGAKSQKQPKQGTEIVGGKILTGALYITTTLFVLGFLWQSISYFLLSK